MIRRLLLTSILSSIGLIAWSQSSLEGKVTDDSSGEPLIFANVVLFKNGNLITGTQTDLDGNYVFSSIDPGTYDVKVVSTGYQEQQTNGVVVLAGKAIRLDFKVTSGITLGEAVVTAYKVPLIEQDNTTQGGIKTAEQIRNLPVKSINAIAATTAGLSSIDGGDINIRGSRTNATNYYIDGIRVSQNNLIPQSEIEQLQVITGGIEARYGDVTGGLISLTTKGPSSKFSGAFELESSELTDPYGYNLLNANISGPILKNKTTGQSILGYRFSGQYRKRDDPDPQAFGAYRAKADSIADFSFAPVIYENGTPISVSERLDEKDVELLKARPNVADERFDITGKFDFRVNNAIDFTVGGSYFDYKNNFSPRNNIAGRAWDLLNWQNNPYSNNNGFLVNARFRHRIAEGSASSEETAKASLLRNISYTIQYGYEKAFAESGDERFKDDLFAYGHVGKFDVTWEPSYGVASDTTSPFAKPLFPGSELYGEHFGYTETFSDEGYHPGTSVLTNYNKGIEDVLDFREYYAYNGFWSNSINSLYSGLHTAPGAVYNSFSKSEDEIHTGTLNASFDFFPGGSDQGRHNIQLGILYEQRHDRNWSIRPRDLWDNMRLGANSKHILGLDSTMIIGQDTLDLVLDGVPQQFLVDKYQTLVQNNEDLLFYRAIRDLTGQSLNDYVNIDAIDPSLLSLDMFSASELTDRQSIGYYGYDYLGNKLSYNTSFDDFFTAEAEDGSGRRTLPVAGNKPIYSAAYIQDKFTFRDIIFRLGLRVDRYDANTKVLRDPYSLNQIMTAADFYPLAGDDKPVNVQDDWKVYVVSDGSTEVRAFRDGDQWYTAQGTPVNDGSIILGNEVPIPFYVEQDQDKRNIRLRGFNVEQSFEDYKPQVSWMPRLAFSFPISEEANFFVHYDVLVQRPPSNTIATALSYFYWSDGPPRNNPNLKPEKTIDFEVGFKQKITNSSAITLTSYYKELRDMIQSQTYLFVPGVPGNSYTSFGNQDFGTVKGFSFSYDLRRTQNLELTAAYTLQFADGTGSSATSQQDLQINARGNLRYLSALSFDERHRLSANLDYRYGFGKQYNGPRWFGKDVFSNAGVSLQANAASGRPYTKREKPERYGSSGIGSAINGSRLPWNFNIDMRIDKSFRLGAVESPSSLYANVYLRVLNLLDTRNIIGLYSASGSAYNDGYLQTPEGASSIQTLIDTGREDDVDNYLFSYQMGALNSGFFTAPRRIYLGASIQF